MKKKNKYIGLLIVLGVFFITLIVLRVFIVVNLLEVKSLLCVEQTFTKQSFLDSVEKNDYLLRGNYPAFKPFNDDLSNFFDGFVIDDTTLKALTDYEKIVSKNIYEFNFENERFSLLENEICSRNEREIDEIKNSFLPKMRQKIDEKKEKYDSKSNYKWDEDIFALSKQGLGLEKYKEEFIHNMTKNMIAQKVKPLSNSEVNEPPIPVVKQENNKHFYLPTLKSIKGVCKNISFLSLLFAKNGDFRIALYLLDYIFYFAKDLETNYVDSESLITKMISITVRKNICDYILLLANKYKGIDSVLTKYIATDILALVSSEYPLSRNLPYEIEFSKYYTNYYFKAIGNSMDSSFTRLHLQKQIKLFYKDIFEYIDRPLYEVENILKNHSEKIKQYNDSFENGLKYILTEGYMSYVILNETYPDYLKMKQNYENCLAKMEFTAIALLINSYYYENTRLPKSMKELSDWFGNELPINRLTNKPYELFVNPKYILFNEGLDKTPNTFDDFYFQL